MNTQDLILSEPHCTGTCKWNLTASGERCLECGNNIMELKKSKCKNCGKSLFDAFSNNWHNPNACNKKPKTTAPSPDCA